MQRVLSGLGSKKEQGVPKLEKTPYIENGKNWAKKRPLKAIKKIEQ